MATIKAIEARSVRISHQNHHTSPTTDAPRIGSPDPIWSGHRRPMLRCQRAGREQSRCRRNIHRYAPGASIPNLELTALSTEVRFKNSGLDAIEVQDNGSGISRDNYENIGRLLFTSSQRVASSNSLGLIRRQLSSITPPSSPPSTTSPASTPSASAAKPYPPYARLPTSTSSPLKPTRPPRPTVWNSSRRES